MKKGKEKEGISLIVLVITIIVIIILATAIIVSIVDNNPISEANKARFQNDRDNMQSIFTNTVAKVMAKNQCSIKIKAGALNEVKSGVNKTIGTANYELEGPLDVNNINGTITFDRKENTDTEYYTGKQLPIYKAGETAWYVDNQGILMLKVGNQIYGENSQVEEDNTIKVDKDEFNALKLRVTELEDENAKLKSELDKTKSELEKIKKENEILISENSRLTTENENLKKENDKYKLQTGEIATSVKKYIDSTGKVATIPIGFAIVPGKSDISKGLVISDVANDTADTGNQFVWIPVNNINSFYRENGYTKGALQNSGNSDNYNFSDFKEPYSGASASEKQEYENIIESIKEYKGFYIGRYEISNNGSGKAQSKKNKTPWASIKFSNSMTDLNGGIVSVARAMYPETSATKGKVVSTLVYGVCFDETIRFLKTNYPGIEKDSRGRGQYSSSRISTGSNNTYCLNNIYDIVGNVWEWTMEVHNTSERTCRGGSYVNTGWDYPISFRIWNPVSYTDPAIGGRVQLYIK